MTFWIHLAVIIVAHLLDLWSTFAGIRHGARELNPTCEHWVSERLKMTASKVGGVTFLALVFWFIFNHYPHRFVPLIFLHHGFMYCLVLRNIWTVRSLRNQPYRHLYRKQVDGTLAYVGRCDLEQGQACGPIVGVLQEERP